MASRSLLVVVVAVCTACSPVLAERAEDISETETRSITIASHGHLLAANQSDDITELEGEGFYTCCLKGYSETEKKPTVEISFNGVEKASKLGKMVNYATSQMSSTEFSPEACKAMTPVPASGCRDANGDPDEDKCETLCIAELQKYKKYHQLTVDAQEKEISDQKKEMQELKQKQESAQAQQKKAEQLIQDLQDKLTQAKAELVTEKGLVKEAQSAVAKGQDELNRRQNVWQTLSDNTRHAQDESIPEECDSHKTCCCLIHHTPVRVDVATFSGWNQCTKSARYPSSFTSKGCGYMQTCETCREKLCSGSKIKGIC